MIFSLTKNIEEKFWKKSKSFLLQQHHPNLLLPRKQKKNINSSSNRKILLIRLIRYTTVKKTRDKMTKNLIKTKRDKRLPE
jgi:hypothetical protein